MTKNISRTVRKTATAVHIASAAPARADEGASAGPRYHAVVGLDVGDRQSAYCVLDLEGGVVAEGAVRTTDASFRVLFEGKGRMRIALEAGTHSPWISRLLTALDHEVLVANPRKLRLIAESDAKHDRADARLLARLAHVGPALLSPIHVRSAQTQIDLAVIRAREVAVQTRTTIVNAVRGMVKSTGHRLPASPTLTFARKAMAACPEALRPALVPLIRLVQTLSDDIAEYDRVVMDTARAYPETQAIQTIPGVGALTAVAFVLVLNNDRSRFRRSRDVGCYLGLKPKQRDSGMRSPQLGITKAGDPLVRRLATQSAQYILGPFGRDSALRRWGLALASRGGKTATKKRAVIAVARKLVVLMHRIWITQEAYDPMRGVRVPSAA